MMARLLALFVVFHGALAHVKDVDREHSVLSVNHAKLETGSTLRGSLRAQSFIDLWGSDAIDETYQVKALVQAAESATANHGHESKYKKVSCVWMACAICFVCCCGKVLQDCLGSQGAVAVNLAITFTVFFSLVSSGTFQAAIRGEDVSIMCIIMCWWAILFMCVWSCLCCCLLLGFGVTYAVKNHMVKQMKADYEMKISTISGPRRDYYESEFFKQKCDAWFDKADVDGSGTLDMNELQEVVNSLMKATGRNPETMEEALASKAPLLQEAFEMHGDSVVEKHEFVEMMKYINVVMLKEGDCTLEQAFEILQCPETATPSEAKKAYFKMQLKYHPDKRKPDTSLSEEERQKEMETFKRDSAQVNDAYAKVEEHFKAQKAPAQAPVFTASY